MFRIKLMILGITALLAIGAINSASASASVIHWFPCQHETGATWHWTTYFCFPAAVPPFTGEYELLLRPVGLRLDITTLGGLFTFKSTIAGIKVAVDCSKEKGSGWIENPTSGNGIDLETTLFQSCTLLEPEGQKCIISEPKFNANTELQSLEGEVWDLLKPDPKSGAFVELILSECSDSALNGTYSIDGNTAALIEGSTSTLKFGKTMDELTLEGSAATLEGNTVELSDAGGGIQAL